MNLKNQRPVLVPIGCQPEIEVMSKAALMDMVWSLATRCAGEETPTQVMAEILREKVVIVRLRKNAREA